VKASHVHTWKPNERFAWTMAFSTLCHIKAKMVGVRGGLERVEGCVDDCFQLMIRTRRRLEKGCIDPGVLVWVGLGSSGRGEAVVEE